MLTAMLVAALALAQGADKPPTPKELEAWAARVLELDARTEAGFAEQRQLVESLSRVALDAAQEKAWRAKLSKLAAKAGPELEKGGGTHWFWPATKEGAKKGEKDRGLYLVGGSTKKPKGLLIGMHGGGAGAGDAVSAQGPLSPVASKFDWVAIFPEVLEKTEHGWTDSGTEEFVLDLIEAAVRTWKIDRDQIFFSGHSMGGYGTWLLGAHHADLVAGLAPSAGAPTPLLGPGGAVNDIDWGVIPNLRNVPIRIYQSDDDVNVPPAANRIAAKKLEEARQRWGGFDFEYWEVPSRQHQLPPGGMEALLEKIADRRRVARPEKLVWQPTLGWKRHFYWLWWDAPRKGAIVEAELDKTGNEVRVTCDGDAAGLRVLLDDELLDIDREVVLKLNGAEVYRGTPQRELGTLARTAARNDEALTFSVCLPLAP